MITEKTLDPGRMPTGEKEAFYFSLPVKIEYQMEDYSLIRYGDRRLIVNTDELQYIAVVKRAAA